MSVPDSPAEFFTQYIPQRFEAVKAGLAGKSSSGCMTFRVLDGGEWSLRLTDGELSISEGMEDDAIIQITVSGQDFQPIFVQSAVQQEGEPIKPEAQVMAFKALTIDSERAKLVRDVVGSVAFVVADGDNFHKLIITPGTAAPKLEDADCRLECSDERLHGHAEWQAAAAAARHERSHPHRRQRADPDGAERRVRLSPPAAVAPAVVDAASMSEKPERRDFRHTKIVCTLGPASAGYETIEQLARTGMNVARLNMSHGTHESHLEVIKRIKGLNKRLNHPISILLDLQGPEIRTGELSESLALNVGDTLWLTVSPEEDPEVQERPRQLRGSGQRPARRRQGHRRQRHHQPGSAGHPGPAARVPGDRRRQAGLAPPREPARHPREPAQHHRQRPPRHPLRARERGRLHRAVVRALAERRAGSARDGGGGEDPHAAHRQDREPGGRRQLPEHPGRVGRHHGGARRPRRGGRHPRASCDPASYRPLLLACRQAGHRRDASARVR